MRRGLVAPGAPSMGDSRKDDGGGGRVASRVQPPAHPSLAMTMYRRGAVYTSVSMEFPQDRAPSTSIDTDLD